MGEFHKVRKVPNEPGLGLFPLHSVANFTKQIKTLKTDEKSSRKMANSKYDRIDDEMNEMSGGTESYAYWENLKKTLGKSLLNTNPICSN